MGLVGNLEDLGLGDILQIVSLSKKSGVLTLDSGGQNGSVMFLEGQVVRATSSQFREHLGDILQKYRLVERAELEQALEIQSSLEQHQPLGYILSQRFGVPQEKIEAAIKAKIERIVYSFFAWKDGVFSFHLEEPEAFGPARLDPLDFMLEQGLSPQWLAVEGSRLSSEGRILPDWPGEERAIEHSDDAPVSFLVPAPEQESKPIPEPQVVLDAGLLLIIDDDQQTCKSMSKSFRLAGYEVETYARSAEFLEACDRSVAQGLKPALLVDLIMPRLDGHGILGGIEVMELVRQKYPRLPLLLMTDHPSAEAEEKAREQGALAVLQKPRKEDVLEPVGIELLKGLVVSVSSLLPQQQAEELERKFRLSDDLLDLTDEEKALQPPSVQSPGLYLLKGMLQELASPLLGGGIILLTLRFASELMNRAVIFDVRDDHIVGLGQFGLDSATGHADEMVRKMRLQVSEDSQLHQILTQKVALKTKLGDGTTDRLLKEQLGGEEACEIFLGPLVSEGKVVAILYGDNLPDNKPIGDVEAFEVFLSQAGMAMEKVLLERRLSGQKKG